MKQRPVLFVLAGVNGAGKSSIGGTVLANAGVTWFNPDTFARELVKLTGQEQAEANALAWQEGVRRLREALSNGADFAFETTLGGRTVPALIRDASATHDVLMWFCGLESPQLHIARVKSRVANGGHDIPESRIRERYPAALENLIGLMPHLAHLQVYDNSRQVEQGESIPDPILVLEMVDGAVVQPRPEAYARVPEWAKPLVEAALQLTH